MQGRSWEFFALFTLSASGVLLWYKRVILAIGEDERMVFLAFCGLGFLLAALALDLGRLRLANSTIVLAGLGWTAAATVLAMASAALHTCGLALAGLGAGGTFYTITLISMRALPFERRGLGFASIFMLAGVVNTSTDLAELPWLRVAGPMPNLIMAVVCIAVAAGVVAWQGWRFNIQITRRRRGEAGGLRAMIVVGVFALASFLLLYALISLYESVAYPASVTEVAASGFIRYVELPIFFAAAWLTDRVGRQAVIIGAMAAALVGGTGLAVASTPDVAPVATLCIVVATIAFPVACCALVADVACYAAHPALLGCLCFAPVVVGQFIEGLVRPLVERLDETARLAWTLSVALLWTVVTLVLAELIRVHFAELKAAVALIEAVAEPDPQLTAEQAAENAGLTRRETEVFILSTQGMTVRQIADELFLTTGTVKFHITNMLRKTRTNNRAELMQTLLAAGPRPVDARALDAQPRSRHTSGLPR
ncbi:MAG: LuxR C-terminal-related transcriptional regulator [Propionibacteriaceae bacterium]|nr:LuxR C-terminal-related transcriptional regulator [Propionibacteriaceae bacterium]